MRTWLIILIFVMIQSASAVPIKDISETKPLAIAKAYWPLPPVEIDGLANQINTQWSIVNQRFGEPTGIEFIREERLGKSFVKYYYLHKFENHAIYWKFVFYKPVDKWKINSIVFEDNLDFLFVQQL